MKKKSCFMYLKELSSVSCSIKHGTIIAICNDRPFYLAFHAFLKLTLQSISGRYDRPWNKVYKQSCFIYMAEMSGEACSIENCKI